MPHLQRDLFDNPEPVPFRGNSATALSASRSGAVEAARTRRDKTAAYLQLLRNHGPISDHEAAALMKVGLSSVNSIRGGLGALVIPRGVDVQRWDGNRQTKRTQWGLR